jgi:tripartite-type tricarboxylate transporter receptor subunit TctC
MSHSRRDAIARLGALPRLSQGQTLETARIITGFAPGGVSDTVSRAVAQKLAPGYARSVVVENRTGAGGQIAVQYVKDQPADGTTILHTSMSMLGIFPHTYKKLPYDPREVTPVSMTSLIEFGIAVGPAVPASVHTATDFFAWCKANPGKASFGTPANGSAPHMAGVLMGRQAGVDMTHVAFRGSQPAILDMIGGQLPAVICPVGEFSQHIASGRCRVIGTGGQQRSKFAPTVATLSEQGFKDMVFTETDGLYVPARTPREIVLRLNSAIRAAVAHKDVVDRLAVVGLDAQSSTPEEYAAMLQQYTAEWGVRVKAVGFTAES